MKLTVTLILVLTLIISTQQYTATQAVDREIAVSVVEEPASQDKNSRKKELNQGKENLNRLNEIENQQKSIHENLKELQSLVNDRCKKRKNKTSKN